MSEGWAAHQGEIGASSRNGVGGMSEVCRTGGLRVKGMSEGYVGRVGGTAGSHWDLEPKMVSKVY